MKPKQDNTRKLGTVRRPSHSNGSIFAYWLAVDAKCCSICRSGIFCAFVSQADYVSLCAGVPWPEIVQIAVNDREPATINSEISGQILGPFSGEWCGIVQSIFNRTFQRVVF